MVASSQRVAGTIAAALHIASGSAIAAETGNEADRWFRESYVATAPLMSGGEFVFKLPKVGDAERLKNEIIRSRGALLPGVWYKPPPLPNGYTLQGAYDFLTSMASLSAVDPDIPMFEYGIWIGLVRPNGDWDLKTKVKYWDSMRLDYENAGNFYFGFTGRALDNPSWFLNFGAGAVGQLQAFFRGNYAPYGGIFSSTLGDDPVDYVWSGMGQNYYDSGQYILDYFDNARALFETGGQAGDYLRDEGYIEATRRLSNYGFNDSDTLTRLKEEEQRRKEQLEEKRREELRRLQLLQAIADGQRKAAEEARAAAEALQRSIEEARKKAEGEAYTRQQEENRSRWEADQRDRERRYQEDERRIQQQLQADRDRSHRFLTAPGPPQPSSSSPSVRGVPGSGGSGQSGTSIGGPD